LRQYGTARQIVLAQNHSARQGGGGVQEQALQNYRVIP